MVCYRMAANEFNPTSTAGVGTESVSLQLTDDRYCRHCSEIALAYDPDASRARCRACGELA